MNFDDSFNLLIDVEAGFTDNKFDRGNWTGNELGVGILKGTKYGISAASYPKLDIKNLTLAEAKQIYKVDFWDKVSADELPEVIRYDIFDMAVNSGVHTAIKVLQKAINVNPDGIIGKDTLQALTKVSSESLDKKFNGYRLLFITSLSTRNWENFGKGWVNRIANNLIKD